MAEEEDFAATVRKRIEAGRQRRDRDHLLAVYQRFLGPGTSTDVGEEREQGNEGTSRKMMASLAQALNELHVGPSNGETMEEICLAFDTNRDGLIDFNEFVAATLRPSHIDAWCKQLSLWHTIADAIPPVAHCDQPLRAVALLTDAQIDVICTEALKSIKSELRTKVLELSNAMKKIEETTKALAGSKFATYKASVGNTEDFHKGLSDRVGVPPLPRPLEGAIMEDYGGLRDATFF